MGLNIKLNAEEMKMSNSEQWHKAVDFFLSTFAELAILFVLVSFIVSLVNHYLPMEKVQHLLAGNRGYGVAMGLGALTPFCSCSTLPMMLGLLKARAAFGPVMAFLFTSPLLNPFVIALFWATFDAKTTLIYAVFVIAMAGLSGALLQHYRFERFVRAELLTSPEPRVQVNCSDPKAQDADACLQNNANDTRKVAAEKTRLLTAYHLTTESLKQLKSMLPYMVIGVAIGAALHGFVPITLFEQLSSVHFLLMIPLSAVIGIFLYVRASTMIPIAASLVAKGLSLSAVMSLTIAGAGASLPEMIMLKKLFHWPLLLAFITLVFLTACVTGLSIELLAFI
jgi:uncharacterized protein